MTRDTRRSEAQPSASLKYERSQEMVMTDKFLAYALMATMVGSIALSLALVISSS